MFEIATPKVNVSIPTYLRSNRNLIDAPPMNNPQILTKPYLINNSSLQQAIKALNSQQFREPPIVDSTNAGQQIQSVIRPSNFTYDDNNVGVADILDLPVNDKKQSDISERRSGKRRRTKSDSYNDILNPSGTYVTKYPNRKKRK